MKGIDVSIFNHPVDWHAVKRAGFDFAICRTGYGKSGYDESFNYNIRAAHEAGLICGAYHYSYALRPSDAAKEAVFCKNIIADAGCLLELPVFFDMEDEDGYKSRHYFNFTRRHVTEICAAFLENIKPLNAGIYASYDWLEKLISWQDLGVPVWNAQWGSHDFLQGFMWQYSDRVFIDGKQFDANIIYDSIHHPQ